MCRWLAALLTVLPSTLLSIAVTVTVATDAPATQPADAATAGAVIGTIRTADGARPPECVVYLEQAGAPRTFPLPARPAVISQKGARFAPPLLVICAGQTVEFHNDEDRPIEHNVFSRSSAKPFDLGLYPPPQNRAVTFDRPGVVRLFCSIHRYMDGMIYVCPTPFFAKSEADGTFRIENVPPGEWVLRTWQRKGRYPEAAHPVRVEPGPPATANVELQR